MKKVSIDPAEYGVSKMEERFGITKREARTCEAHGTYSSAFFSKSGNWTGCPECEREERSRKEMAEQARQRDELAMRRIESMIGCAAIPPRFKRKTFSEFKAETPRQAAVLKVCMDYAENFPDRLKDGQCLVMLGNPGTGKTHLAAAIASEVVTRHRMPALYSTVTEAVRRFKDNWTTRERAESEILSMFASPALLVLDEIGVGWGSDTELLYLFEIINARYQQSKPTILAGNITREQVRKCVGDRVAGRLNEGGGKSVIFNWESMRESL